MKYLVSLFYVLICSTLSSLTILEFAIEPTSVLVREGSSAMLDCQTKLQNTNIHITWKKGQHWIDVLPQNMKTTFTQLNNNSLYFPNVSKVDEDTYICGAAIIGTSTKNYSRAAQITLAYIVPHFISNPGPTMPVREFSQVLLSCVSGASLPFASIIWVKNGQPLDVKDNNYIMAYIRSLNATSASLQLNNVSLSDAGYYGCVATNPLLPDVPRRSLRMMLLVLPKDDKPRIEVHPVNSRAPVNRPFHMDCVIVGVPPPDIYWLHNGKNVTNSSDGRRQVFLNGTLYSKSLAVKDNGIYSCTGVNDKGSISSSDVFLQVAYIGYTFKKNPQNETVVNGSAVELVCEPPDHSQTQLTFKWYKNYWSITVNSRVKILSTGSLVLNPVLKSDEGVYACGVTNTFSFQTRTSTEGHLTVHVPPYFISKPSSQTVVLYEQLHLTCVFGGSPPPTISWYHGNTLLSNSSRTLTLNNDSLVLRQVEASDAGVYRCVILNIAGNQSAQANIRVHVAPNATVKPRNTSAVLGEDAIFFCQFQGNPPPKITWVFSRTQSGPPSVVLTNSTHFVQTTYELRLVNVTVQHRGWFTCVGTNDAGLLNFTAYLDVFVPARLTKQLHNITVNESDTVQMTCEGFGYPMPIISWFKENHLLTTSGNTLLDHGTLLLKNVTRDDAGLYSCNVENKYGNQTTQAHLIVQVSPVIYSILGATLVQWKQNVTFECRSDGIPKPGIVWYKDDALITYTTRILTYGDVLSIVETTHQDTGNYTCEASNIVGSSTMTTNLTVQVPPDHPIHLFPLNSTSTSLTISWNPGFNGYSPILAYRVDIRERNAGAWETVTDSVTTHDYVIQNLRPYVEYGVRVYARNNIGWSVASKEIVLSTQQDSPSAPVNLFCVVYNATAIHLSWDEPSEPNGVLSQYRIMYKRYDHSSSETVVTSSKLQHIVSRLDIFTMYDFRVQASTANSKLWGNVTSYVRCRTGETAPAVAPKNVQLVPLGSEHILVSWLLVPVDSTNGVVRQYTVQYKTSSEGRFMQITVAGNTTTQLNLTGLRPWTDYVVRVAAVTVHRGPWSTNETTRTLESVPSGPPTKITIKGHTSRSLLVSWQPPLPDLRHGTITNYRVFYTKDGVPSGSPSFNTTTNKTMVYLHNLFIFTTYVLQISAATSVGYGPLSSPSKATTLESYPGPVRDVSHVIVNRSVLVTWSKPRNPNGVISAYNVRYNRTLMTTVRSLETNTTIVVITTSTYNVTSHVTSLLLSGFPGNMTYSLCVAARTSAGYGQCSNPITFSTNFSRPSPPPPVKTTPVFTPQIVDDHLPLVVGIATVVVVMVIILLTCFLVNRRKRKYEEKLAQRTYNFRSHAFTMSSYGEGTSSSVASHGSKPLDGYSEDTTNCSRDTTSPTNHYASVLAEGHDQSPLVRLRNSSLHLGSEASSYDDAYSSVAEIGLDPSSLTPTHSAVNKLYADLHRDSTADDSSTSGSDDDNSSLQSAEINPIYAPPPAVPLPRQRDDDDDRYTMRPSGLSNVPNTVTHTSTPSAASIQPITPSSPSSPDTHPPFLYDMTCLVPPPPVQFSDDVIDEMGEDNEVTDF